MKEFVLELDRPRRLVYDFDAWDLIADRYSKQNGKEFDIASLNITYRDLPFLVYAGLKWEDEKLTFEQTKRFLNEAIRSGKLDMIRILETVMKAIFAQSGVKQEPEINIEVQKNGLTAEGPQSGGSEIKEN